MHVHIIYVSIVKKNQKNLVSLVTVIANGLSDDKRLYIIVFSIYASIILMNYISALRVISIMTETCN